ncbi:MAG: VIT1/CCC1 transporter family protein [Candidatus Eremiobacteraeota bacterium]|nr:VIT1/CCC1 transporter family protein [Candidatus Eremiobacteraeota bacterium]
MSERTEPAVYRHQHRHHGEDVPVPFPVVVDLPGWKEVKPRIPDTAQRRTLEKQRSVREIVFGAKDGVLTTMGVVTGVGVASGGRSVVLISGLLALLAGTLSMGVGEYQGAKSEREVVQATIKMESEEMAAHPEDEFAEQVAYYKLKGFSADEAHTIVARLVQNPEIYLYEMIRDEFGIDPRAAESSSIRPAVSMGVAYAAGSIVPILPYFFPLRSTTSVLVSFLCALIGLFVIGYFAGKLSSKNPYLRGLEIALYGSAVFGVSYLAGHFIPPLFGYHPIAVGG